MNDYLIGDVDRTLEDMRRDVYGTELVLPEDNDLLGEIRIFDTDVPLADVADMFDLDERVEGLFDAAISSGFGAKSVAKGFAAGSDNAVRIGGDMVNTVNTAVRLPGKAVKATFGRLPFVGAGFNALVDLSPTEFAAGFTGSVIRGERIDKAFLKAGKRTIAAAREVAPYVQTVLSFVPGVGTGVSAAIAAGVALSEGRTITDSLLASVKGAIPGGPAAQAAFDTGLALAEGTRVDKAVIAAGIKQLPPAGQRAANVALRVASGGNVTAAAIGELKKELPPAAEQALDTGLRLAKSGKDREAVLKEAALRAVQANIPATVKDGLDIGIAMGAGKRIQSTVVNKLASKEGMGKASFLGRKLYKASKKLQKHARGLNKSEMAGYQAGLAVASTGGLTGHAIMAMRQKMPSLQKRGFDHALKSVVEVAKPGMTSMVKDGVVLRGEWRKAAPNDPNGVEGRLVKGKSIAKGRYTREPIMTQDDWKALARLSKAQQDALRALSAKEKAQLRAYAEAKKAADLKALASLSEAEKQKLRDFAAMSKMTPEQLDNLRKLAAVRS